MCRLVAWLGEPLALARLLTDAPHSLSVQSYAAQEMVSGVVNADGYGAGWYLPGDPRPCVYRSAAPIWADPNLDALGRAATSRCAVAAVRNATPGMPYGTADTQPFAAGAALFVHNGFITGFRERLMRRLRAGLGDAVYAGIAGGTDSEHVFALVRERLDAGAAPAAALRGAVGALGRWSEELGLEMLLTTVLTDGERLVATRLACRGRAPSLYVLARAGRFPGGVVLASERLDDDPAWVAVPDRSVVEVGPGGAVEIAAL